MGGGRRRGGGEEGGRGEAEGRGKRRVLAPMRALVHHHHHGLGAFPQAARTMCTRRSPASGCHCQARHGCECVELLICWCMNCRGRTAAAVVVGMLLCLGLRPCVLHAPTCRKLGSKRAICSYGINWRHLCSWVGASGWGTAAVVAGCCGGREGGGGQIGPPRQRGRFPVRHPARRWPGPGTGAVYASWMAAPCRVAYACCTPCMARARAGGVRWHAGVSCARACGVCGWRRHGVPRTHGGLAIGCCWGFGLQGGRPRARVRPSSRQDGRRPGARGGPVCVTSV